MTDIQNADGTVRRIFGKEERRRDIEMGINEELGKDHDAFLKKPWKDHSLKEIPVHPLADYLISDFKKCILALPPGALEIFAGTIDRIAASTPENISFGDVGLLINAMNRCEPKAFAGDDFDLYLEKRAFLDKTTFVLNEVSKIVNEQMVEKKTLRMKLAAGEGWNKKQGGLIITQ